VNVTAPWCARAFRLDDGKALGVATRIRALLAERPLIPSVKAAIAYRLDDPAFEDVMPPLVPLPLEQKRQLIADVAPLVDEAAA
jgi:hypothetical protein